jgi:NAD-dependent DNA ligase
VESANPYAVLSDCLTAVRGVNKTDVLTLSSTFGSLKNVIDCSMEELSLCPGLGARKVKSLYETFRAPLDPTKKKKQKTEAQIESFLSRKVRAKAARPVDPGAAAAATATNGGPESVVVDVDVDVDDGREPQEKCTTTKQDKGKEKVDQDDEQETE